MQAGDVYTVEVIFSASFRGPRRMPYPKVSVPTVKARVHYVCDLQRHRYTCLISCRQNPDLNHWHQEGKGRAANFSDSYSKKAFL